MLSILIPIYNEDITRLVKDLSYQCNRQKITYEIICFDDKSRQLYKDKNEVLRSVFKVNYVELSENLGRAKIRNWLAKSASFDHLLFLDGDSKLINKSFIKNYIAHLPSQKIIVGGRIYKSKPPRNVKKILHWKYGSIRESLSAQKRQKAGFIHFHSNNFIIPATTFNQHQFDPDINGYGYEDLVFAQELENAGYEIIHIDNPTRHNKIENVDAFLAKTLEGIANLHTLYISGRLKTTRLIRTYEVLNKYKLIGIVNRQLTKRSKRFEDNLQSENPSIRIFNLWKLHHFIQLMNG